MFRAKKLTHYCYLVVGGNGVSSFLSWRLQASNSCDVTLVWKNGFDHVSRYGVSFKYVRGRASAAADAAAASMSGPFAVILTFSDLKSMERNVSGLGTVCFRSVLLLLPLTPSHVSSIC